jgi:molecular chaperone Hsp33
LRGVARWREAVVDANLESLTGGGRVTVTVESAGQGSRYQGIVPLSGARLADCFEDYFARSEQLPTRLWLAASGERAAGLLLQRLPSGATASAEELAHASAEGDEDWNRVRLLAATLSSTELLELSTAQLLRRLFHEEDLRLFEPDPVFFQCTCSRERVSGILRSIGAGEVRDILAERGSVEVRCEFCNRAWQYDAVDVAGLFADGDAVASPRALH